MPSRPEARPGVDRLTEPQREARDGRTAAHAYLLDAVASSDRPVPCVEDPSGGWTSDVPAQKAAAAEKCYTCPVLEQCAAYIEAWPEPCGVWAGQQMVLGNTRPGMKPASPRGLVAR
ncbi:WhiB family transcriptional regulator [Frigoribacterium sp. NPDC087798]|uniref:WhiB family transcriptional regulator n=1 Tax=Frigoribacterium sp. NPDC087798 TaxID=3363993 RepID=UPI00382FFF7A